MFNDNKRVQSFNKVKSYGTTASMQRQIVTNH